MLHMHHSTLHMRQRKNTVACISPLLCLSLPEPVADHTGTPSPALSNSQVEQVTQIAKAAKHDAHSTVHSGPMSTGELLG